MKLQEYLVHWKKRRDDGLSLGEFREVIKAKDAEEAVRNINPGYDYYGSRCRAELIDIHKV